LIESALLDMIGRDPADRILVATALRHDLRLATADTEILEYARASGRLRVLDVRA
jgi:PIN domain nuclease of toxin-antitoxin system